MGLPTRPALVRRAGLLSWTGRKLPCDHAPQVSAGRPATGSSRKMLTTRIKGKPAQPSPRTPSHPARAGWSQPLQCLFLLLALQSCVSLLPHPLICSYIYNSDSLSPSRPNAAIYSPSYSGCPSLTHSPRPSSYFILYQCLYITTDPQMEDVNGLPQWAVCGQELPPALFRPSPGLW